MAEPNGVAMQQQQATKPQYQFNGIHSNHSSRGASPASQLPPIRGNIPMSQLPPSRGPIDAVTQKIGQLSVSGQNTPNISPNKLKTSTPNPEGIQNHRPVFSENPSPVVPSNMESVPLNDNGSSDIANRNLPAPQNALNSNIFTSSNQRTHLSGGIPPTQQNVLPNRPQVNLPSTSNVIGQNYFSQPNNVPQVLQNQNMPPQNQMFSSSQSGQVLQNKNMSPQNQMFSSSQSGQSVSNFGPSAVAAAFPSQIRPPTMNPQQQNFAQYPQQVKPTTQPPSQPQFRGVQQPPQFNTGLPARTSPYNQLGQGQVLQPPTQRLNPQINYNAGPVAAPPPSLNGPSTLPPRAALASNRYPTNMPQQQQQPPANNMQNLSYPNQQYTAQQPGVVQTGFNRLWGSEHHDLLQLPNILPPTKIPAPQINLGQEQLNQANCSAEVFRCTVTKIPETAGLLQKSRLPLGLLIHPFKDLSYLPVIQCNVIVRCRSCRTYINPFVYFVDTKRWKCNLCFRVNELPEEFQYDPVTKTYGDPSRRPEIKSSTIEYIAPAEYMLRPPQPAVYLFLLDVSRLAFESGYLEVLCNVLLEELKNLPGDARTQIGFLAYDSALHFFSLAEGLNQPHEMTILDIDDVFLPTPDNLLVNLKDRMEMVEDLLKLLPQRFSNTFDGNSALGAALQVAHKMMGATGGRVSVFQSSLPNTGPGAVTAREDPSQRSTAETPLLNPVNDFYKRLALECSGQQIAVDLFVVNSQYVDMATISGISRFSGGSIHHFPLFKSTRPLAVDSFQKDLRRYLTRKIGFEAVMRVRCTRGLAIHTFHGNFFVRSTDLLSLPNINPDSAFGMQVAIEETLTDTQQISFQAALLYTSSKGERRIRVHTLCLPLANTLQDVINSADQQCIVGLLGKMAVDRSMQSSLSDAREAFINAAVDQLTAYKFSLNMGNSTNGLLAPECLKLLPLFIAAILKHPAFRIGTATRLDDRVKAMIDMKTLPLPLLMQQIYPDLYPIHNLELQEVILNGEEEPVPLPPRLHLSSRCLENKGAFLMDCGDHMMILVGPNVSREFLNGALGVDDYQSINDGMLEIPVLDNLANQRLHQFINYLNDEKPYNVSLQIIRDNSPNRGVFLEKLIEDRLENSLSYHEFLQHLKTQVK
ncbi:unnamed protein product [Ceutorhynchus assimilis]|uniref:Protein transport protein Sec24A n=1 Tax=Ceutorhynchus assimilis TaxID=467358 RepID=A0A9N9MH03_9CUCU|nr:unnamed protein product [Ceutorhynchus assimilis]